MAVLVEPFDTALEIVTPSGPAGVRELASTVAGAVRIEYQRAHPGFGQCTRLQRHHRAATVHLLGERRQHEQVAARLHTGERRKVQRTQVAPCTPQHEGVGRHGSRGRHLAGTRADRLTAFGGRGRAFHRIHWMPCCPR